MSLPSENSWEEQGATAQGKGRAGRMCIGKNAEEKNGGMARQDSEKTERCGMEEELNCSVGEVPLDG